MSDHVYEPSLFWALITGVDKFANFFGPWLLFVGCLIWAFRVKAWQGWLGLIGGLLVAGSDFARRAFPEVTFIALGGMQPTIEQNPFVFFFYMHGGSFGLVAVGIALTVQFFRRRVA